MKKTIIGISFLSLLLVSSCSYNQMNGAALGGTLGAIFGSSIGGLIGGPRGSDAGGAIGMLIGGAAGTAAVSQIEKSDNNSSTDRWQSAAEQQESSTQQETPDFSSFLTIDNLRLIDPTHSNSLTVGGRCQIVFEIFNHSDQALYNVAPIISCDSKRISISPTAIIESIQPGKGVRYRAEVVCNNRPKHNVVNFNLSISLNGKVAPMRTFQLKCQ